MGAERVPDHTDGPGGGQAGGQGRNGCLHVVLLAQALVVRALGAAHPPEIEAQRGVPGALGDLSRPAHDGVVPVPAIERMGVAEDEASGGRVGRLESRFQSWPARHRDDDGLSLHTNPDLRDSVGNIQVPAVVSAYEVYFS